MTKCTCTYIEAVQKVKFVMRWRCYNTYLWFEIERNLSPPDAFYGIFYVQNPFAAGASRFGPSGLKLSPPNPKTKLRPCVPPSRQILATPLTRSITGQHYIGVSEGIL